MGMKGDAVRIAEAGPAQTSPQSSRRRWCQKIGRPAYPMYCFVLGMSLVLLPWLELWDRNYFWSVGPAGAPLWTSPFVRGAVSGLGVVNIGIAFSELFRIRRLWKSEEHQHSLE